jgi:hypothetical protein
MPSQARSENPKNATQAHYISIYRLNGVNSLPVGDSREVKLFAAASFEALLTSEPEPHFAHIDRSRAVLDLWAERGIAGWTDKGQFILKIAAVKEKRAPRTNSGVFVVLNGTTEIPNPEFRGRRDSDEFSFSLDDVSRVDIRNRFKAPEDSVLTALSLSLPDRAVPSFDTVGEAVYLTEEGNAKPIYVYNVISTPRARAAAVTSVVSAIPT